jgi:hydroxybutyrate-dimer hydrolase
VNHIEVTHAQHTDSTAPGYDNRSVPLGHYFRQALDLMWDHVRRSTHLPPSQVVHTPPEAAPPAGPPPSPSPMAAPPAAGDRIAVSDGTVRIPEAS